jgi:hypothetical protein
MARIRTIKPEFWEDEKIASLPIPCRLFYIGTWNIADDNGVFRGNPVMLKSKIFPYDENLRASEVQKWLDALVEARMLIPVINDPRTGGSKESYYVIRTFHSHQKFDARYPNYLIDSELLNTILSEKNAPDMDTAIARRVPGGDTAGAQHGKGNGKGNGKEPPTPSKGEREEDVPEKTWRDDFEVYLTDLWNAYKAAVIDTAYITERAKYHPGLNIRLSLEKACAEFWGTQAGWKHKKKSKSDGLNWRSTFTKALDQKCNHVWLQKGETNETGEQKKISYI